MECRTRADQPFRSHFHRVSFGNDEKRVRGVKYEEQLRRSCLWQPVLCGRRHEGIRLARRAVAIREAPHRDRALRASAVRRGKADSAVIAVERRRDSREAIGLRADCGRISRPRRSGVQLPAAAGSADLAAAAFRRLGAAAVAATASAAAVDTASAAVVDTASAAVVDTASAGVDTASAAVVDTPSAGVAATRVVADTEVTGRRSELTMLNWTKWSGPSRRRALIFKDLYKHFGPAWSCNGVCIRATQRHHGGRFGRRGGQAVRARLRRACRDQPGELR